MKKAEEEQERAEVELAKKIEEEENAKRQKENEERVKNDAELARKIAEQDLVGLSTRQIALNSPETLQILNDFMSSKIGRNILERLMKIKKKERKEATIMNRFQHAVKRVIVDSPNVNDVTSLIEYQGDITKFALEGLGINKRISLEDIKKKYDIQDYGGDGDCGYYSLLAGLKYLSGQGKFDWDNSPLTLDISKNEYNQEAEKDVKERIVKKFRINLADELNKKQYRKLIPNVHGVQDILGEIQVMGKWIELGLVKRAINAIAKVQIQIFTEIDKSGGFWITQNTEGNENPELHVYYINPYHYKFMKPKTKD